MSRLIDADKLIEDIYSNAYACTNYEVNEILHNQLETNIYVIDNQPTAFDVDKVVEQLHKGAYYVDIETDRRVVNLNEAIEIVKDGGRDERNT